MAFVIYLNQWQKKKNVNFERIYHLSIYMQVFREHTKYFCHPWRKHLTSLSNHNNNDRKSYFLGNIGQSYIEYTQ